MWNVSENFKRESVGDWKTPTYAVSLYDDVFTWTGADFSGTYSKGFYDMRNQKRLAGIGTSKLEGVTASGTIISMATPSGTYFNTIGTWTSQIITAFYPMTFDKLQFYDFNYKEDNNEKVYFREGFDSFETMNRNGAVINFTGTIEDDGTSRFLRMTSTEQSGQGRVSYPNININSDIFEEGRMELKGKVNIGTSIGTLDIMRLKSDTGVNVGINVTYDGLSGTHAFINAFYYKGAVGTTLTRLGTVLNNTLSALDISWGTALAPAEVVVFTACVTGRYITGTTARLTERGNVSSFDVMSHGTGFAGTFWAYNATIRQTYHGSTALVKENLNKQYGKVYYGIRTSDDGTTFSDWYMINNGNKEYDTSDKSINAYKIKNGTKANYAQIRAILTNTSGTYKGLNIDALKLYTHYDIPEKEVISISPITTQLESEFVIGQIENNGIDLTLSNIGGTQFYGETQNEDWRKQSLFYNRPIYMNNAIKVSAGFSGSWGTELLPLTSGIIKSIAVSEDEQSIDISGVNIWGKYSDVKLKGTSGTYNGSDIINIACKAVNIPTEKRYISKNISNYNNIPLNCGKYAFQNQSAGGFGDTWNYSMFDLGEKNVIKSIAQSVHPTKGNFKAISFIYGNYDKEYDYDTIYPRSYHMNIFDSNFNRLTENVSVNSPDYIDGLKVGIISMQDCDTPADTLRIYKMTAGHFPLTQGTTIMEIFDWKKGYTAQTDRYGRIVARVAIGTGFYGTFKNEHTMFFDSIQGTGFYLRNESGTVQKYDYWYKQDVSAFGQAGTFNFTGTETITAGAGTHFNITAAFMLPKPIDTYLGTNFYYYACYGYEGTNNYMYRFGTGTGQNWGFVDKVYLGTSFNNIEFITSTGTDYSGTRSGGYFGTLETPQGTQWYYISGTILDGTSGTVLNNGYYTHNNGITYTGAHRLTYFNGNYGWAGARERFNTGLFGLSFQHNTVNAFGSLSLNGVVLGTANYQVFTDKTAVIFNNLYTNNDIFSASYSVYGISLGIGTFADYTFKDMVQKIDIPIMSYSWFDGNGNFFLRNRSSFNSLFELNNSTIRNYDLDLTENMISGNTSRDIEKVRNAISVSANGTKTIVYDASSILIYGTRELKEYTNDFIPTPADMGTVALMMLENFKYAKTSVSVSIPFHPEIEIFDKFKYTDVYNNINVSNVLMKSCSTDLMNFTTEITGIEQGLLKTGTNNNL
jgi:hypothetical protein